MDGMIVKCCLTRILQRSYMASCKRGHTILSHHILDVMSSMRIRSIYTYVCIGTVVGKCCWSAMGRRIIERVLLWIFAQTD